MRRLAQSKQGADRHIAELNEEMDCLRKELKPAVQTQSRSVFTLREFPTELVGSWQVDSGAD